MEPLVDNARLRHRAEIPLLIVSTLITVIVFACAVTVTLSSELQRQLGLAGDQLEKAMVVAALAPIMPFIILFVKFFGAAKARANGVKVGPNQFPTLYNRYQALAERIQVSPVPDLYVVNGNGVVNAYALSCNSRRTYVVVHSEIARLIDCSPQVVDFVLAHELGHHKLGHVSLVRNLLQIIPGILVLPGKAFIRAQEYSADRVAVSACGACSKSIGLLAVGPLLENQVNSEAYYSQAMDEDRSWFVRMVHWISDHAVNTKRLKAIVQMERNGLDAHGDMF